MANKSDNGVSKLVAYALGRGLVEPCERSWAINSLLDALGLESYTEPSVQGEALELAPMSCWTTLMPGGCWGRIRWCTGICWTRKLWGG